MFAYLSSGQWFAFGLASGVCLYLIVTTFYKAHRLGLFEPYEEADDYYEGSEDEEWLEPITLKRDRER